MLQRRFVHRSPADHLAGFLRCQVVDDATAVSVVWRQPWNPGKVIDVHQVIADWYGMNLTLKVDRSVSWQSDNGNVAVGEPLPPSLYVNSLAKGKAPRQVHVAGREIASDVGEESPERGLPPLPQLLNGERPPAHPTMRSLRL